MQVAGQHLGHTTCGVKDLQRGVATEQVSGMKIGIAGAVPPGLVEVGGGADRRTTPRISPRRGEVFVVTSDSLIASDAVAPGSRLGKNNAFTILPCASQNSSIT